MLRSVYEKEILFVECDQAGDVLHELRGQFRLAKNTGRHLVPTRID
jgi:hypothetical protein